jgi:hypothetical protein
MMVWTISGNGLRGMIVAENKKNVGTDRIILLTTLHQKG